MGEELDLWRLAAGLGLFLFGMHQLEQALSEVEISTLLNVNREVFVANHNIVAALADAMLDIDAASDFAGIPATR